ncbi:phosphonate metabolism transcriptional regulator PhnF [Litorilinea aerophila]|uniref:Phosphonate metabolism transcriptional regulator PhnF n=1 Tax=Litorilinea aerophila TaxID=1204385 RepID=A0A540VE37_9CHLR|nr:phosphonate metabolism transcriptional regulator PhnF [Litorilinea aerophila]MCC9077766.1 phosphonate metabolism transcriptional regulator PhnF [Litorilinea aerophila]GIV79044.1 MAG: transcriptional regulator [Litorilinea sp.]
MSIDPNSATPLYIQIKDRLQEQIEAGAFEAGERLPSERELAQMYSVSRMTARQALQLLQQTGLVLTRVGKGTYVNPKIHQDLQALTSFTQEMVSRGLVPSSRVLLAELQPAHHEVAVNLGIDPGDEVVVLQRIRCANEKPIALETAHLAHARFPGILNDHDFARVSLYQVLQGTYGVRLSWASQVIAARMPTPFERRALEMPSGTPVLSLARVSYDSNDRPVEYVRSCYHGERYELRTTLR